MPELDLLLLGNRIREARKECGLTQQELADQTRLAVKTVQDIEKGRKSPTYETLVRLIARLGISPDTLFPKKAVVPPDKMQQFLENFHSCDAKGQEVLLNTVHFLAEQLRNLQDKSG